MKKLLILGANPETIPLVETAKKMGIFTIVADPDPNAPAKKFADRGVNIDGIDIISLAAFCNEEKIDGVLVGVADRLIQPYQQLCEMLHKPCYGNRFQCEVLTDKGKFNDICQKYGLKTIPSVKYYRKDNLEDHEHPDYPIIVKPVDKNSGKGITLAYSKTELQEGIHKAFEITKSNYVLLEKFMDCRDLIINYTVMNGVPTLSALGDRYTTREQGKTSQVCLGAVYPSSLLNLFLTQEHPKLVKLFKGIKLENAIVTISAFVEEGNFHYYDPGFRLQGEAPNLHMEIINKFDQKKFLLNLALGENADIGEPTTADFNNKHNATIWFLLKKGIIGRLEGLNEVINDPCVFHVSKRLDVGDKVEEGITGTEGQVGMRVYVTCSSKEELKEKIIQIHKTIKISDINNNNQLLTGFIPHDIV
jgi:biotin carboxylase